MSLRKAIASGKEHRGRRRGCGISGCCGWCRDGRTFARRKIDAISRADVKEFEKGKEAA